MSAIQNLFADGNLCPKDVQINSLAGLLRCRAATSRPITTPCLTYSEVGLFECKNEAQANLKEPAHHHVITTVFKIRMIELSVMMRQGFRGTNNHRFLHRKPQGWTAPALA
jgi:hypothetical protein